MFVAGITDDLDFSTVFYFNVAISIFLYIMLWFAAPFIAMFYEDMSQAPVLTLGPVMEKMSRFANRTNVEFIVVHDRQHLEMRVWERGSGETMACGTGACASAIAAMLAGYVDTTVTVSLLGGDLQIHWNQDNGQVEMTGPGTEVFSGEIVL